MTKPPPDISRLPFSADRINLQISGKCDLLIAVPENPDTVLNEMTDEQYEKDRFLPYWAEQWPSAGPLSDFLIAQEMPRHWHVCELGCGLGIITAALSSCQQVTAVATDIAPEGCRFAAYNIHVNSGCSRVVCSDWRHLPFKAQFDAVIASDVIYEERWINPILNSIDSLLKPDGRAWIADPCRRFWPIFKNRVAERGFLRKVLSRTGTDNGAGTVEILEITR